MIVFRALVAILPAIGLVSCSCPRPPEIDNIVQYIGVDYQPLVSISNLSFAPLTVLTARCQDPTTQTFRGRRHRRCNKRNNKWTGKPPRCESDSLQISFPDALVTVSPVGTFVLPVTTPFVEIFCTSKFYDEEETLTMYMHGSELQPVVQHEDQINISYNFTEPSGSQSGTLKCQLGENTISKKLLFQEREDYCPDVSANPSDNFTVQYSAERKLGSLAYYTCAENFEQISGSAERMCLGNHTWDRDPIVCIQREREDYCPDVSANPSDNFTVQYSAERKLGSLAYYTCAENFEQIGGSAERMCLGNHTWDRDRIVCIQIECGTNMVWANCTNCQRSCSSPEGECENNCNEKNEQTCVCPSEGYLMNGDECVTPEECGCYFEEEGVIAEGDKILNSDCTQICSCRSNALECFNYKCHANAECMEVDGTRQCVCQDHFQGDGINCTAMDCGGVYEAGHRDHGVYHILPDDWTGDPFPVYCNMSLGGGWTVIQRQEYGSEDFNRTWTEYKNGFGSLDGDMWLGNEKIHHISNQFLYDLRIDFLTRRDDYIMSYDYFEMLAEGSSYEIILGNKTGTTAHDYMRAHSNMPFTTYDRNGGNNCTVTSGGGWWYINRNPCYYANLNGEYGSDSNTTIGLRKPTGEKARLIYLTYTEMKIRRSG